MMKLTKAFLFGTLITLLPGAAYASGDAVLLTLEIQAASIIIFLIALIFIPVSYFGKLLLFTVYALTVLYALYSLNGSPEIRNETWANLRIIGLPILTVGLTYLLIRKRPQATPQPQPDPTEQKDQ